MRLGLLIHKHRITSEISVRDMAREIGINFSTLHRLEAGEKIDAVNFMKILNWLVEEQSLKSEQSA